MLSEHLLNIFRTKVEPTPPQVEVFDALADPGRYKIVRALLKFDELCVTDAANLLGVSLSAASQQFTRLEQAAIVIRERKGQMICYRINYKNTHLKQIIPLLN